MIRKLIFVLAATLISAGCAPAPTSAPIAAPSTSVLPTTAAPSTVAPSPSPQARAGLTPPADIVKTGKLRVAFRTPDFLALRDFSTGKLVGLHPDIAAELARRTGVQMVTVEYSTIEAVLEGARSNAYDVGFETVDPTKTELEFTNAFAEFGLKAIVPAASPVRSVNDVDRPGIRVAVARGSTPDRYFTQNLKQATLVRKETIQEVSQLGVTGGADVFPGPLATLSPVPRGFRLLDDEFFTVRSAIVVPKGGRADLLEYVRAFVEDVKASGFVKESVDRNKLVGVTVPLPGR